MKLLHTLNSGKTLLLLLALFGLLSAGALLYATAPGLAVSPDSVFYYAGANSLLAGDGYTFPDGIGAAQPITHFPPFYPLLLAGLGMSGVPVMACARALQVVLFAGSGMLLGWLLYRSTGRNLPAALLGALFFWVLEDLVLFHTYLWTEGLYYFLTLLGFYTLERAAGQWKWRWLIAAAVVSGLAFLTRYAGLANVIGGALVVFLLSQGWRRKVIRTAVFSLIAGGLPGIVFLWQSRLPGSVTDRGFHYNPALPSELQASVQDIARWLLPGRLLDTRLPMVVVAGTLAFIAFFLLRLAVRMVRTRMQGMEFLQTASALYIVSYGGLLLVTVFFLDAQTGIGDRLLSPLIAPILLFAFSTGCEINLGKKVHVTHLLLAALLPVIAFNAVHSWEFIQRSNRGSMKGYNGTSWQEAEIIHWLDNLPEGTPVYSNGNDAVYFVSGRPCARLPYKYSPFSLQTNRSLESDMQEMDAVLADGGVVLYFPAIRWRGYLVSLEELEDRYSFEVLFENESGYILGLADPGG